MNRYKDYLLLMIWTLDITSESLYLGEKDIIEGRMSGSRARGRSKMNLMSSVTSWTGLTIEGAIRAVGDSGVWRKIVYDVTNPRSEDGSGQDGTGQCFVSIECTDALSIVVSEICSKSVPCRGRAFTAP